MKPATWDELLVGTNCPLCFPRPKFTEFVYFVRKLSVSSFYLSREQTYRGASALVYDSRHVVRIDQLSASEWARFAVDIQAAESAVFRAMNPDHINVASLGNMVPHLHFGLVPRYKTDGRWRDPIWMTHRDEMPNQRFDDAEYADLARIVNLEIDSAP